MKGFFFIFFAFYKYPLPVALLPGITSNALISSRICKLLNYTDSKSLLEKIKEDFVYDLINIFLLFNANVLTKLSSQLKNIH